MTDDSPWPPRRWYMKKRYLIPLILIAILLFLHLPNWPVKIEVGPDTTVIDGPLNADGTVNYVAYLDGEHGRGVTGDNNAAPLLLKVMGESMLNDKNRSETLRRLNLDAAWLTAGPHFVAWEKRVRQPASRPASQPAPEDAEPRIDEDPESGPDLNKVIEKLDAGEVHGDLARWLADNEAALEVVRQAAARPRYYLPLVSFSDPPLLLDCLFPNSAKLREVAKALCLRARLRCRQGRLSAAWDDVLTVHRLSRLVQQESLLISQLVAVAIDSLACDAGRRLATRGAADADQAQAALKDLQALPALRDIVDAIDRGERFFMCDATMMLSRGTVSLEGMSGGVAQKPSRMERVFANLDWNEVLRINNRWYDEMVRAMRMPRSAQREQAMGELHRKLIESMKLETAGAVRIVLYRLGGWPTRKLLSRQIANLLMALLMPALERAVDIHQRGLMGLEVEKTALALACHKARHGRWPARLDDLVGESIQKVPTDVFTGQPLVYRIEGDGYVLYSVGINGRDDGGLNDDASQDKSKPDDIAARVPAGAK